MTTIDAFLAPVVTEVLLTALTRLRADGSPSVLCLGSPWLIDVPLFPGIFAGSFPFLLPGVDAAEVASLGSYVETWIRNGGNATVLVHCYDLIGAHKPQHRPSQIGGKAHEYEFGDELAKVAHDPEVAKTLAKRAGFPPEHLPEFKTASIFWNSIIEHALLGMADVSALIIEVTRQFPHNEKLSQYRGRIGESRESRAPTKTQPVPESARSASPDHENSIATIDWPKKVARSNELELGLLAKCLAYGAEVIFSSELRDRFVVVPDIVIIGSATITSSNLYLNRERLSLFNRSSAPHDYETARAVCENYVSTARLAGRCTPPYNLAGVADVDSLSAIRRSTVGT